MTRAEETKYKLSIYLPYLQLMSSLNLSRTGITNKDLKNNLIAAYDLFRNANEEELKKVQDLPFF